MAASASTIVFLLSLICIPSRFLTGAVPPPPPTVAKVVTPPPATPSKPLTPTPATPPKRVTPPPATPSKPGSPPPATPSKPVLPPPAAPPKLVLPRPAAPPKPVSPPPAKPVLPPPATPPKLALPPTKAPPKPVTPPRGAAPMPAMPPALLAPIPWDEPGYASKPIPEPIRKACARTLFPDLCGRMLAFAVDPKRANDTRHLAEASARAAIQAGTAVSAFGYVYIAGAKNGTRLRLCVRDCTVRIDAAVKNMTASVAAMKRGAKAEAAQLACDAAKGFGVCWGSCAKFTGEAMFVMIKRARQFERLVMIAGTIIMMIL